jgi:hypothetical protein
MFDSGIEGFSPIVMVAHSDLKNQQDRIKDLLTASTKNVFLRRSAEAEKRAYEEALGEFLSGLSTEHQEKFRRELAKARHKHGVAD